MTHSRKRQSPLTRVSVTVACTLAAILACTVLQPSATVEAGDVVCTLFLKASFRSMFLVQDDPIRVAEDNNLLCDMCSRLARLAIGSINDERVSKNWRQVVRDRGCSMEIEDRLKDCSALTEAVLSSQSEFFTSDAVKLSPEETNTTETLSLAVQSRSVHFCRNIRCCKRPKSKKAQENMNPAQAPPNSNFPGKNVTSNALLANSSVAMQKQVIAEDRAALNRDLELMDAMKDNLDKYNQRLSKERARLETLDKKLKDKEKEILTGVMRERMIKKAKELEEKAAEEGRKRKAQEEADDLAAENAEAIAKGKGSAKLKPETPEQRVAREQRQEERKKRKEKEAYEKKKLLETKKKADAAVAAAASPAAGSTGTPASGTAASGVKFKSRVHENNNNSDDDDRDDDRDREADDEDAEEEFSEDAEDSEQAEYAIAQPGDQ